VKLSKNKSLSIIQILKITEQIASALVAAHEAHIVHRDIKPEKIMIRRDGYVKVLDFGLAKPIVQAATDGRTERAIETTPGMIIGSVRYMSPEQARGLKVDERTDIWSLGVVLYEMLTGEAPFDKATSSETLGAVIYQDPERLLDHLPNAPGDVQSIIDKSLEKEVDKRYQRVVDFALDVKNLRYNLEHESSLERRKLMLSRKTDISENPTIVHQTVSANHSTNVSGIPSTAMPEMETGRRRLQRTVLIGVGVVVLLAVGLGIYRWYGKGKNPKVANFERIKVSRLNSDGKVRLPAISPDGKYIAYASGEAGNRSLVVQLATDSEVTVVPPTALDFATVSFAPSGDYVLYTQTRRDYGVNTLYQVPTLGGPPKKLIEDVDSAPTFAPNGKRLAFIRHVSQNGEDVVFTANADGSNVERLISRRQTEFDAFGTPAWSPNGAEILISAGKGQGGVVAGVVLLEVAVADGKFKIFNPRKWNSINHLVWLKDASGFLIVASESDSSPSQVWRLAYPSGTAQAVTNDLNNYSGLGVSSDGSTLITLKNDSVSSLWTFTPSTKDAVQVTPDSPNLEGRSGIKQTPDGKLIYTRNDGKEINLWMSDVDGKNSRRLTAEACSYLLTYVSGRARIPKVPKRL
jgi:Tol biopolymer transport system component